MLKLTVQEELWPVGAGRVPILDGRMDKVGYLFGSRLDGDCQTMFATMKNFLRPLGAFMDPAWAYGSEYWRVRRQLENSSIEDAAGLYALEDELLRGLFTRLVRTVPYYQGSRALQGTAAMNDPRAVLAELPLLSKEIMREDIGRFTDSSLSRSRRQYNSTSGTSTTPFGFFDERRTSAAIETGYMHFLWNTMGYERFSRYAVFRGSVTTTTRQPERLWYRDPLRRAMVFSSYHLSGKTIGMIYRRLLAFDPEFIHAFPSSVDLLAAHIEETNAPRLSRVRAVFLGSENISLWQRERISRAFGAPVYSWYGHSEKAVLAAQVGAEPQLFVLPTYGYIYLRSEDGRVITEPNEVGEIIASGFTNRATQFVNYRTGDYASWDENSPRMGLRQMMRVLKKIDGRAQEYFETASGARIAVANLVMHDQALDRVREFRFVHERRGMVRMEIVKAAAFAETDEARLRSAVMSKLGPEVALEMRFVNALPRTGAGKGRVFVREFAE